MANTWYVTFEVQNRAALPKRRSPRETKTFATEKEARAFARQKLHEGLAVHAGTMNPYVPRQSIPSSSIPTWLASTPEDDTAELSGTTPGEKRST